MRILITGAAGFIGFCSAVSLLKKGHIIYGIDSLDTNTLMLDLFRNSTLGFESNLLIISTIFFSASNSITFF